mmetsp:Transcript_23403/g.64941  ORF Transcript_23403/g.64941 Transcript_23403/m.64941 type:complete len:549 (-) Transcript_23403:59-1705(-)
MELRTTEQKINDLLVEYEGILRSPVWKPEQQALLPPIPKAAAPSTSIGIGIGIGTNASPRDEESLVKSLRSTEASLAELLPRVARFRKRLFEIDPVTEKPRYGPKSRERVKVLVRKHGFLCDIYRTNFPEEEKQQWLATKDYQTHQLTLREERQNERRKDHARRLEELAKQQKQQQEQEQAEAEGKDDDGNGDGDNDDNGESQEPLPIADADAASAAAAAATSTDATLNPDGSIIVHPESDDANPEPPTRGKASPSSLLFAQVQTLYEQKQREQLEQKVSEEETRLREEETRRLALAEEEALKKAIQIREASERAARELAERQRLHQQAEEARLRRRAQEEARKEAEKNWLEGIRKGPEGVRHYLDVLLQRTETETITETETGTTTTTTMTTTTTTSIDPDRIVALRSLCILFEQIQKHPEEVKKRKIKRSNPNFHRDIGRHEGGVELLVAAGFRPTMLPIADGESDTNGSNDGSGGGDGGGGSNEGMTEPGNDEEEPPEIAFLISKEPNLEHDMDGWMAWFDLNKATLEILQNELEKIQGKNKRSRR